MKYEAIKEEDDDEIIKDETEIPGFYVEVREHVDIRRVKTTLFAILAAKLVLALCYLAIKTYFLISYNPTPNHRRDDLVMSGLVSGVVLAAVIIIYLCLFLIAVVKNKRLMILIFAWLSIVDLILCIAVIILGIMSLISAATSRETIGVGLSASILIVIGATIVLLLTMATIVCSFELARLINLKEQNLLI